jgi:hypothetical protein
LSKLPFDRLILPRMDADDKNGRWTVRTLQRAWTGSPGGRVEWTPFSVILLR